MPKRFCVISQPRSGSNFLLALLNSHPEIICHGELFHRRAIYSKLRRWPVEQRSAGKLSALLTRNMAPRLFLNNHMSMSQDAWPTANAIGFKHFPSYSRRILRYVCRSPEYEIIYLSRINTVLQYASERTARNTDIWVSREPRQQDGNAVRVSFSMQDFLYYVDKLNRYDKLVRSALGDKSFLEIAYEDMESQLPVILERLGVGHSELRSRIKKQGSEDWVERFSNPDSVQDALKSTKFAEHLR